MRRALALTLLVASACTPATTAWHSWGDGGATIAFPTPPEVRRVREGPWADATVASAREAGTTYELARFVLTRSPDPAGRTLLLAEVERGLTARLGVVDLAAADTTFEGRPARRLRLAFADGAEARFVVFYRDARTLVELSVYGPRSGIDERAARFFGSYSASGSASSSPSEAPSSSAGRTEPRSTTQ
jgi:hypothetical protein